MRSQTPDHHTLLASIFVDSNRVTEEKIHQFLLQIVVIKKSLSLEAAIAGERAEIEIAARKRQLDLKKKQLDLLAEEDENQELEDRTLREQKVRQMQIELSELSSRKSDSSIHSLQSFSWKDSASLVSIWVDNVLTENFTLDLQSADIVKYKISKCKVTKR